MARSKTERLILESLARIERAMGIEVTEIMADQSRRNRPEVQLTDAELEAIERAPKPRPDLRGLPESDNPVEEEAGPQPSVMPDLRGLPASPLTGSELDDLGLTAYQSQALRTAGYHDRNSLRNATDAELEAIPGIGAATVRNLRDKL